MAERLIRRGEVYWVNLPLPDKKSPEKFRELQGKHPAVVISNDEQNKFSPLITVLPLTSTIDKIYPFQVESYLKDKKGVILVDQIRTIDRKRFGDRISQLEESIMERIEKALHLTLALRK